MTCLLIVTEKCTLPVEVHFIFMKSLYISSLTTVSSSDALELTMQTIGLSG